MQALLLPPDRAVDPLLPQAQSLSMSLHSIAPIFLQACACACARALHQVCVSPEVVALQGHQSRAI